MTTMLRTARGWRRGGAALALLLALPAAAAAGEGFGTLRKKVVWLDRVHPPAVHIEGTRIAVRAKAQARDAEPMAARLQSQLESELLQGDPRLVSDPERPQTVIDLTVLEHQASERWDNRRGTTLVKTGEDAKGKPIYAEREVTIRYQTIGYRFAVAYKARDARNGANLNADTLSFQFSQEFQEGQGAPAPGELEGQAVAKVVGDVVRRLVPTVERVGVLLPRGSLDDFNNLAEARLWSRYLEALETLPARPKKEEEAYRQYGLGLANEALGYAAEDAETTLRHLQQAALHYNQALEAHPGEKYFSQPYDKKSFGLPLSADGRLSWGGMMRSESFPAPFQRVQSALVQYQRLKENRSRAAEGVVLAQDGARSAEPQGGGQDKGVVDNEAVIQMVAAGLPEDVILTAIDGAEKTAFDVSPQGLIELSRASVSQRVLQSMQAKAKKKPAAAAKKARPGAGSR